MPTPLTAGAPVDPAPSQHEHRRTNGPPLNLSRVVESSQPAFISSSNRRKRKLSRDEEMSPEEEASASPPAALIAGREDERRVSSPPQGSKFLLDDVPCTRVQKPLITKVSDEEVSSDEEGTTVRAVNDVPKKQQQQQQHDSENNEDSCGTSDVEKFDGKIVYNPDGSAYIIDDSELSEEDTIAELPKLIGDGCIIDGRGISTSQPQSFPQIANAFYVSRNPSLYSALYGSSATLANRIMQDKKIVPEVPIMHSYRVYTVRDKSCDREAKRENEENNKEDKDKQFPGKDCSSVPVKPILMCFICKLSFGYAKSFVAHAMGDHNLVLREDEKEILGQKNASAIIQCVGKEKEPLVSFLEPLSTTIPDDKPPLSAVSLILKPPHKLFGSDPVRNSRPPSGNGNQGSSECAGATGGSENSLARRPLQSPVVQNHVPEIFVSLPQHASSTSSVNNSKIMNSVMDLTRKSPVTASGGNTGRSSASPGAGTSPSSALSPLMAATPTSSLPYPPPPPNFLTGTTIGVCPDHIGGRPSGVECAKCELILSSSRLGGVGGPLAGMHSRNSCKTLKCPKCNWHYKYQETLEIHMKEKHPESETSCIYCIAGQPHPRLARGETYTCGYKPYRCEVCNYSTTTKGNLSIHMQSDKHLNNMQELQNGGVPTSESSPSVMQHSPHQTPPQHHKPPSMPSPSTPHHHLTPVTSAVQNQKPKPTFRCDVCNYETNVARNLRIHMTSEKHTHNMMVLQQNVKHMQTLSALHQQSQQQQQQQQLNFESLLHFHPGLTLPGDKPPPHTEAALADMAYNQALLIQMMTGGQLPPHIPPELAPHMDMGLNPDTMEPPPEPADPNPSHLFTCCVCNNFSTDSLEALSHHLSADRTKIREQEILAVVAGHYVCKLCTYKTNLKANFQLHCKTDKHLQRLQHVNHVKEGGPRNEWKLKYVSSPGGIQVRCHPCDYYTNSAHKLQLHTTGQRHEAGCLLFRHLREAEERLRDSEDWIYHCALCVFSSRAKLQLFQHVRSMKHLQMEQLHQLQRRSEGKDLQADISEIFQVIPTPDGFSGDTESERKENQQSSNTKSDASEEEANPSSDEKSHSCPYCNYSSHSEIRIQAHILAQHPQSETNARPTSSGSPTPQAKDFLCPLCQDGFRDRASLERHVMQIHSVNSEGLQRLLMLVDQSHWLNAVNRSSSPHQQNHMSPGSSGGSTSSQCKELDKPSDSTEDRDEPSLLSSPVSEDNPEDEYRCQTCLKNYKTLDELYVHQNELGHIEIKQTPTGPGYVCWKKGCNQYFTTINTLQLHYREIHIKNQQNMSVSEKHVYKYRCNQCSLAFKTIEKLQLHSQYHIIRDATKCILCGRNFRSIISLHKHVELTHTDLSEEELNAYKQSLMNNPLILAGLSGNLLDSCQNDLLRRDVNEDEDDPMDDNSDDSYKEQQFLEDYLNSQSIAEDSYKDPNRKYKCHKCKVAFTRQTYLTSHNKTLLHRKGEKMNYPMEKYMDPNRPFKCDVCKESFTQKNILLVHYNSVSHLHKLKKAMQEQQTNNNTMTSSLLGVTSPPSSLNLTKSSMSSSEEEDKKPYKCNICKVAYSQGSTLDIHMRSVLHQTRASKLQDLVISGQIDINKPLFEQPNQKLDVKKVSEILASPNAKFTFPSPSSNSSNQQGSSPINPQSPKTDSDEKETLNCQKCNAGFQSQDQLTTHQQLYCLFGSPMNLFPPITNSSSTPNRATTPPPKSPGTPDDLNRLNLTSKKCSQMYKHLLESFGFDLVMQFNENHQRKKKEREEAEKLEKEKEFLTNSENAPKPDSDAADKTNDDEPDLPEVNCKSTCQHCHKEFSSVWVLKAHCEEVHKELVPIDFLEKYAEEFKTEYEKKTAIATTVTTTTTTAISTPNTSTSMSTCTVTSSGIDITPEKEESKDAMQKIAQMQTDDLTPPTASSTPASSTDSIPAGIAGLSPGVANPNSIQMTLAQQMNEMQAAFNAMAASQLQQQLQQFNPMMMGMAGLGMGLPLGLNMPALAAMNLQPPLVPMMMPPPPFDPVSLAQAQAQAAQANAAPIFPSQSSIDPAAALIAKQQQHLLQQQQQAATAAQQKRARTRITDDQLKILRAHFDINNSPSEEQIHEMAAQSGLPPKVIKHWFRNTLFKERQRNKDSPYNFNNPPSTTLNLEEYEKTGEAKVMPLNSSGSSTSEDSSTQKENSQRPPTAASISSNPVKKEPASKGSQSQNQQQQQTQASSSSPPPAAFGDPPQIKSEPRDRENSQSQENDKFNFMDENRSRMRRDSADSFDEKSSFHSPVHHFPPQSPHSGSHSESQVPQNLPSSSPNSLSLSNLMNESGNNIQGNLTMPANMLPPKLTPPNFASPNQVPNSSAMVTMPTSRSVSPARSTSQEFFSHSALGGGNSNGSNSSGGSTSGKRANRTRFTDYQIKVLQEFFENNAYPKDDDLEYLSKLLSLSPRVIVVWFQNARQKARKVYENQPPVEPAPGADGNEAGRFQRTPGLNYQCKKCLLVFQRYYELIRHQKTHCFKEEDAKRSAQAQAAAAQIAAVLSSEDSNSSTIENQQHQNQPTTSATSSAHSNPPTPSAPVTPTPTNPSQSLFPQSPAPSSTPTPDSNNKDGTFQCDKCNLVFPRFDLWREHQLVHIMNPNLFPTYPPESPFGILQQHAQLQQQQLANMSVDLTLNSQQHPLAAMLSNKRKFEDYDDMSDTGGDQPKDKRLRTTILPEQLDYLYQKYQIESNPSRKMLESIAREVGLKKRVVQVWFQNTRARERKGQFRAHAQVINKRCPFCPALFKVKSALESHLQTKHSDQYARGEINIDSLPDEELSLESVSNFQQGNNNSNAISPLFSSFNSDMDSIKKYYEESMKRYMSELQQNHNGEKTDEKGESPLDLSKPVDLSKQMKVTMDDSRVVDMGPLTDVSEKSLNDDDSMSETTEMFYYDDSNPVSPASSTQSNHQKQNKRFRTQMSNTQIKVMKSLFNDYKTPTMSECEILGREISLPKRVIQVWFQNARAKDKKAKLTLQKGGEETAEKSPEECKLCNFKYSHKYSVQDHIFTKSHIDNVKMSVEQESGNNSDQDFTVPPIPGSSSEQSTPVVNHNNNNNTTNQHLAQLQILQMAAASGIMKDKIPMAEEMAQLQMLQLAAASGLMLKSDDNKKLDDIAQLQLLQMAAASGLLPKLEMNKEMKEEMALLQQLYGLPGFMHSSMVNSSAGTYGKD